MFIMHDLEPMVLHHAHLGDFYEELYIVVKIETECQDHTCEHIDASIYS
jgi:hypothetical protein